MVDKEHRRKPYEQCSRRHQRRIIQEDIKVAYRQNPQYVQSYDNFYNNVLNSDNLPFVDETEPVCITNSALHTINRYIENDSVKNSPLYVNLMEENNCERNMQLLEKSSDKGKKMEYFETLISEDNEYSYCTFDDSDVNESFDEDFEKLYNEHGHYIFDDSDVNELFDEQSNDDKSENLKSDLHDWILRNNVPHKATHELLQLLSKYIPNTSLPKDARTLHTIPTTNYISIAGGEYIHFGLSNVMVLLMDKYVDAGFTVNNITLSLNIDGLPISKSSSRCLWPILVCDNIFKSVHIVGIFCGTSKPTSANDFLERFINEFKVLVQDGFTYGDRIINVSLSTIICDAPARSFVLYTRGHNGFSSCSKCTIVGEYIQRTMCFPYSKTFHNLRTDKDFAQQTDDEYHRGETLLLQIPNIGLVSAVALDYMHLICLGVVKKLLLLLMKGPLTIRIGSTNINLLSEHLIALRSSVPKEFSRKPRSLTEIKYWKATEFRQFLLYTGPIVLKSVLTSEQYKHFLALHVAISILITPTLITSDENIKYAEELLAYFVEGFQIVYGKQFVSHNIHNLLHLTNEVRRNGVLDNFSAFPFESFLGSLKKLIRKPEKPLQQIARRYTERQFSMFQKKLTGYQLKYKHNNGSLVPDFSHKSVIQFKMQTNQYYCHCDDTSNHILMLDNKTIVRVLNIIKTRNNDIYIIGQKFNIINNLYDIPCFSSLLSIFMVVEDKKLSYWHVKRVICKMWAIPTTKTKFIVIPLRHYKN